MSAIERLAQVTGDVESADDLPLVRIALFLVVLLLVPPLLGPEIATFVVCFGLAVIGMDILLGYTGYISFGHAAFFGAGAYAAALVMIHAVESMLAALFVAVVVTLVVGAVFGYIAFRRSGVYFAMITLALAQVLYFVVRVVPGVREVTNGSDGLTRIPAAKMAVFQPVLGQPLVLDDGLLYVFSVIVFLVGLAVAHWITQSPYGLVIQTIRENEERSMFLGYDPLWYKLSAFVISGVYAGVAGALIGLNVSAVGPTSLFWTTSADILIMLIVGGMGTINGAILGSAFVLILEDTLSAQISATTYRLYLGIVFVFFVFFVPQGIWNLNRETLADFRDWVSTRLGFGSGAANVAEE